MEMTFGEGRVGNKASGFTNTKGERGEIFIEKR
jgi:hypothetical protein